MSTAGSVSISLNQLADDRLSTAPSDHEIFRLQDEIEAAEGADVTFYGTRTGQYIS